MTDGIVLFRIQLMIIVNRQPSSEMYIVRIGTKAASPERVNDDITIFNAFEYFYIWKNHILSKILREDNEVGDL